MREFDPTWSTTLTVSSKTRHEGNSNSTRSGGGMSFGPGRNGPSRRRLFGSSRARQGSPLRSDPMRG
jgi:hypothetical protein